MEGCARKNKSPLFLGMASKDSDFDLCAVKLRREAVKALDAGVDFYVKLDHVRRNSRIDHQSTVQGTRSECLLASNQLHIVYGGLGMPWNFWFGYFFDVLACGLAVIVSIFMIFMPYRAIP